MWQIQGNPALTSAPRGLLAHQENIQDALYEHGAGCRIGGASSNLNPTQPLQSELEKPGPRKQGPTGHDSLRRPFQSAQCKAARSGAPAAPTIAERCPSQQCHAVPPGHPIRQVALPPAGRKVRRVVKKALAGHTIHPSIPKMSTS